MLADTREAEAPSPETSGLVFVVDDNPAVLTFLDNVLKRFGLRHQLFSSAEEFMEGFRGDAAGCLILDLYMPGTGGLNLLQWLSEEHIFMPVLVLTGYGSVETAVTAMKSGAFDFLQKPVAVELLMDKVHAALSEAERQWERRRVVNEILERLATLTPREEEILDLILQGYTSREIAERLGVAPKTVEAHRRQLRLKLHAQTTAELVGMVLRARADDRPYLPWN